MKTIEMDELPPCDFCVGHLLGVENLANDSPDKIRFDGPTIYGSWGFMCPSHFESAGLGQGTKLVPRIKLTPQRPAAGGSIQK